MTNEKLVWADIVSPMLTREEYDAKFKDEPSIQENYSTYIPKPDIIQKISSLLSSKNETIKILAMGAAWCKDCKIQVPHLLKIVDALPSERVAVRFLYGIKTDPFRKPGDLKWSARHSPPEAINPKFEVNKIPMIYIFNSAGDLLAKIEERPQKYPTIEEIILSTLK
jgi:thiol-disulfide isomerase/thioredoxin